MLEILKSFATSNGGLIATIVLVAVALNLLLSGLHDALGLIKDKTATTVDNKLFDWTGRVAGFLQKVIEYGSANRPNVSPSPAKSDATSNSEVPKSG